MPEEYDYRFKSVKKEKISTVLQKAFIGCAGGGKKLGVTTVARGGLKEETLTKHMAR